MSDLADTANEKWRVIRQDTHGTRYLEMAGESEARAKAHAEDREKQIGAHHQSIWAEKDIGDPRAQPV